MQLSLYHELLAGMINCTVDMTRLVGDLGLDLDVVFSDAFLAEVAEVYMDQINLNEILESNTLNVQHHIHEVNTYRNYGNSLQLACPPWEL